MIPPSAYYAAMQYKLGLALCKACGLNCLVYGVPLPKGMDSDVTFSPSHVGEDAVNTRRTFLQLITGATALSAMPSLAVAQAYPSRPITIVVPFGPGSGTDTVTRVIAQPLSIALKQSIIIENKTGANGAIAATQVARSAPDGYTLLMSTNSPHSAAPSLNKTLAYDPLKDFVPVTRAGSYTFVFLINPSVPVKSIAELIAYPKANPGKLSYGSGNTSGIVAGETFKHRAGVDILHVPYKTVPTAMTDVLGGRVSMVLSDLTPGLPHIRSGSLRALAVTRLRRSSLLPDVPSLHETGVTNFDMDSWAALFAPARTPPEIVARLNAELRPIIDSPEIKTRLADVGFEAFSSTPEELRQFTEQQLVKWTQMIKEAAIEPE
jgi:tripartite-type tricarboxylate transporter receptor subunit TctC